MDPAYLPPGGTALDRTRFYSSIVPRFTFFEKMTTLEGGQTENGGFQPGQPLILVQVLGDRPSWRTGIAHGIEEVPPT